jgi:hypothetical protein
MTLWGFCLPFKYMPQWGLQIAETGCCPETADLYREGSGENSEYGKVVRSGALSIESFEGSRRRSARRALSMGILSGMWL